MLSCGDEQNLIIETLRLDLRNAVQDVLASVDLAEQKPLSVTQRGHCDRCRANAQAVIRILDDILTVGAGGPRIETTATMFSPDERIQAVVEVLQPLAEGAGVTLETEIRDTPRMEACVEAFEDAATRILNYAIRAAGGGVVRVFLAHAGTMLSLRILVRQAKPVEGENELTLYLARALFRRIGAKLQHHRRGDEIFIEATLESAPAPHAAELTARVLAAEIPGQSTDLLANVLSAKPYRVDRATDGEEAVAIATRGVHDVIFLDTELPRLNGYAATRRIREWEATRSRPHVPILLLSTTPEIRMAEGAAAGSSGYLIRPIEWSAVMKILKRFQGN